MIVKVKYFGMIAEKIGATSESFELKIKGSYNLRSFFEDEKTREAIIFLKVPRKCWNYFLKIDFKILLFTVSTLGNAKK